MSACPNCGAPVRWVKSATTGDWMVLDAHPAREGNVVVTRDGAGEYIATVYRDQFAARDAHPCLPWLPRYFDHHTTCSQTGEWRRQ